MKKMRMWLLAGLLLCGVGTSFAQSRDMVRFGIGLDMTANRITNYYNNETCGRIGFNVGLKVDVNFTDNVYLGTGFQYAQKGAKKSEDGVTYKSNPGYLTIPVRVGYRYDFNDKVGIFGEFGPYFAVGVGGKNKWEAGSYDEDEDFFGDTDEGYAKRFDCGLGIHFGVELIKHLQIGLGYDFGLVKMYNNAWVDDDNNSRNGSFRFGVAWMF